MIDQISYGSEALLRWYLLLGACAVGAAVVSFNWCIGVVLGLGLASVGLEFTTALAPISRLAESVSLPQTLIAYVFAVLTFLVLTPQPR